MITRRHLVAAFAVGLAASVGLMVAPQAVQAKGKRTALTAACSLRVIGAYRAKAAFPKVLTKVRAALHDFTKGRGFKSFRSLGKQKFQLHSKRWHRVKLAGRYYLRVQLVEQILTSDNVRRLRLRYEVWQKARGKRKAKRLLSSKVLLTRGGVLPYGGPRIGRGRLVAFLSCR